MKTLCYCDGSCHNNSYDKMMGVGVLVVSSEDIGQEIFAYAGKNGTNNKAEYLAVILALDKCAGKVVDVGIHTDSQLVVRQITGEYRVNDPDLKHLLSVVKILENNFNNVTYSWIPRDSNQDADRLSKLGNPHFNKYFAPIELQYLVSPDTWELLNVH